MTAAVDLPIAWRVKHLTRAEQLVVELIVTGLTTKEVAARLGKSTFTVGNQLQSAMRKLDVTTRFGLIAVVRPLPGAVAAVEVESEDIEYAI